MDPAPKSQEQIEAEKIEELRIIRDQARERGVVYMTNSEIQSFMDRLEIQYGREVLESCTLWHLMSGSGMGKKVAMTFDLDGRIERFMREVLPHLTK